MADVTVTFGAEDTGLQRTLNTIQTELNQLRTSALSGEQSVEELKQTLRQVGQLENVEAKIRQMADATNALGTQSTQAANETASLRNAIQSADVPVSELANQILELKNKINQADMSMEEMRNAVSQLSNLERLQQQINRVQGEFQSMSASTEAAKIEMNQMADAAMPLSARINSVQAELVELRAKLQTSDLTMEELEQTMRRVSQLESLERRLNAIGTESVQSAAQVNRLQAELQQTGTVANTAATGGFTSFRDGLNNIGTQIAVLYGTIQGVRGMFNFMVGAIQNAVDLNEAINRSNVIFGDASQAIQSWASTAATAFGQSSAQAISAATQFALFGRQAGLSGNDLIVFSQTLTALASDMASFANTSPQDAITALGAALRGEQEPIRRYGVLLDDATLKNRALADGIRDTTTGALTPGQRVLAAYSEILQQTGTQQGDFARTNGELANQVRILQAEFTNTSAALGDELLPVANAAIAAARSTVPVIQAIIDSYSEYARITNEAALGIAQVSAQNRAGMDSWGLLGTLVGSVIGPLTDLRTGTTTYIDSANAAAQAARDAANGIQQVGYTSTLTAAELTALQSSTQQTATSMSTAFQGVGGIFSDINANISTGNTSLEQFNLAASGAQTPLQANLNLFGQQVAEIGNINTVLGSTQGMLGNQYLTLGTINNGYEMWRTVTTDINAAEERKAEILELQNQRVAATLADLESTLQTGLNFQGLTFSNISGMATNADNARNDFDAVWTHLDEMNRQNTPAPVVGMAQKSREARQLIEDFGRYIGQDLSQMPFPDIARRLGINTMGMTGQQQIDAIVNHINSRLNNPVNLQINTNFDPSLVRAPLETPINLTINGNFDPLQIRRPLEEPINMNLSGGDFVNHTRNLLSQPINMVFTDGLGFAPMIRQDLSQPINMNLLSGGFETQTRTELAQPLGMNLNSGGFENTVRSELAQPLGMNLTSGGFENTVRSGLSSTPVTMSLSSGGFEQQVQSNLSTDPVTMSLDGSQGVAQIQQDLSGPVTPQFDFNDFDRQWSQVRSTINAEATGGPGGEGGGGGQGGPGGDGGDFDPAGLSDVVTAIEQVRDRLPISVLAP